MAEVALQAYENEIDQMIEEARYLEALAHLRHILSKYPRYLGAYYLLGKMLLEADLPELAVDMFRRVLNADPEHFLARIGLGLAHDHLGKPEAAIWNLEQAFELASGDEAIHDELRRLIGQRDGVTPDHIPMSRTGLARLYLRGNLFGRAVEELRNLVTAHPERSDLQVALTEAYWRDDQIVLAAENCQKILDAFPYNLKANLLLGVLLQSSGQEGSTRYVQRAQEVDPENRVAEALFGANGPLPAKPKLVERLVYDPEALDVDQKARWFRNLEAASVTIGISETMPQMTDAEMRLVDVTADLESQIEIPEWLRDLSSEEGGEGEGAEWLGEESETPEDIVGYDELASWLEPEKAEPVVAATEDAAIPDWLQELQPPEVEAALEPTADEEVPEWLRSMQPAESEIIPPRPLDEAQADEALPDWLAELRPPATAAAGIAAEQESIDEELPEWLREAIPAAGAPESGPSAAEDTDLGWLQELEASAPASAEGPAVEATESEDMFGWETFSGHEAESPTSDIAEEEEGIEPLPDWLAELAPPAAAAGAAGAGVAAATAAAGMEAAEESEELPEWLAELKSPAAEPEAAEETLEPLPDWLAELEPPAAAEAETATGAAEAEEMFGWLSFPESEPAAAEAAPEAEEELPEWLAELKPPTAEVGAAAAVEEEKL
ncbi:MAG: hypothetical protein JW892_08260, partial [Anaerolineae bacterium]|nr:hypothetical protein [Anaerolineae bacterium]